MVKSISEQPKKPAEIMLKIMEDEFPQLGGKKQDKRKDSAQEKQNDNKKKKKKKGEAVDVTSFMFKVSDDNDWD